MISHPLRHWHGVHVSSHWCPSTCPSKSLGPCPGDWFRVERKFLHSSIATDSNHSQPQKLQQLGEWAPDTTRNSAHPTSKPVAPQNKLCFTVIQNPWVTCLNLFQHVLTQAPPVPSCLALAQCPRQGFDCCHSSRIAARWCPKKDGITTIQSSCFQVINWIVGDFNCCMLIYIADVAKRYTPSCVRHQASWQALLADSE